MKDDCIIKDRAAGQELKATDGSATASTNRQT
jgi:hypothetical protein